MYTEEDISMFWKAYQEMFYPEDEMYADCDDDDDIIISFRDIEFYNL